MLSNRHHSLHSINILALCLICLMVSCKISSVHAETITITQSVGASIGNTSLMVDLEIRNEGDSPAYNVIPRIFTLSRTFTLPVIPVFEAGKTYVQSTSFQLDDNVTGEYHILSLISYDDHTKKQHANSAQLYLQTKPIIKHPVSLKLVADQQTLNQSEQKLVIKNHGAEKLNIDLQFITPLSVAISQRSRIVSIDSLKEISLPVILNSSNFNNIGTSPLFIMARYTYQDIQLSQLLAVPVNDMNKPSLLKTFFTSKTLLLSLGSSLVVILIFTLTINIRGASGN